MSDFTFPWHTAALSCAYPGGFAGSALPHRDPILQEDLAQAQDSQVGEGRR